jgi:hypothetical protein
VKSLASWSSLGCEGQALGSSSCGQLAVGERLLALLCFEIYFPYAFVFLMMQMNWGTFFIDSLKSRQSWLFC